MSVTYVQKHPLPGLLMLFNYNKPKNINLKGNDERSRAYYQPVTCLKWVTDLFHNAKKAVFSNE